MPDTAETAKNTEAMPRPDPAPPCAMVIFGASGDLTKRLLMPAIYNLKRMGLLPDNFYLLGVDHNERTVEAYLDILKEAVERFAKTRGTEAGALDQTAWDKIAASVDYLTADFDDPAAFPKIAERLKKATAERGIEGNAVFYLAVSERFFEPIVSHLGESGLMAEGENGNGFRRVIIEKPFGHDFESAKALNRHVLESLNESQVYRIDHYLGKETVQNIMVFRFANGIFERLWNRDHIDNIQITVAETVGVERRGNFYERAGALKDMVPNHLFQLLSMTAMEPPVTFAADAVRTEKVKVLDALRFFDSRDPGACAVRGQYDAGTGAGGRAYKPYRQEERVDPNSMTETFVAMKLTVDNWRWAGMPFYLRTGKALAARKSEVVVQFKHAPFALFRDTSVDRMMANQMILHIQPDEGLSMQFGAKVPGPTVQLGHVQMTFKYKDYFETAPSTGYETLVYDCMIGDATLFQRADAVEAGWRVVDPLLQSWEADKDRNFQLYPGGSSGPKISDELLTRDGRKWHPLV